MDQYLRARPKRLYASIQSVRGPLSEYAYRFAGVNLVIPFR